MKNETTNQYLEHGKNLTILNGKKPIKNNWTQLTLDHDEVLAHKGNKGWVIGATDLVVDVDPQNGGDVGYEKLVTDLGLDLEPTVTTPSGGFHIYLSIPNNWQGKQFHKTLNSKYEGVDFLTAGSQCVIAGSSTEKGTYEWADDLFGGFVQTVAPDALLLEISYDNDRVTAVSTDELGDFTGMFGGETSHWLEADVLSLLEQLNPSMTNDDWVKVGQGLHDWSPVDGLEFWENWSKGGDNYTEGETAKRWKSFKLGGGVTLGTVSYMAKKATYDDTLNRVDEYIKKIAYSDEKALEFDVAPAFAKEVMSKVNSEKIAKALQDRYVELTGVKMPISTMRSMITRPITGEVTYDAPEWCHDWVYVSEIDVFINSEKLTMLNASAFNMINGKHIPYNDGGTKPSANKYVSDKGLITVVDAAAYLPMYSDFICYKGKRSLVNTFNHSSIPAVADKFTDEGLATIEMVKAHIKMICTTDENAAILTQWLVHQVQYMGVQMRWSPIIQGMQGVGKSFFGVLLRLCLGDENVGTVGSSQVTSDFNSWATGVVVNVLEELHVSGKNRHEAMNALKPLITDSMIQINQKGIKQVMAYNTTNYICFTNDKDSLSLTKDDRRWWVIFVPFESDSELDDYLGKPSKDHYQVLFDSIRKYSAEIRKWMLEYKITDEFKTINRAPMTDAKLSMIATEESGWEGLDEVKDTLNEGGKYWNNECVCSTELYKQIAFQYPDVEITAKWRTLILKKLGFTVRDTQIKLDGKVMRFWTKREMTNDQIRESLEKHNNGGVKSVEDYFTD